MVNYLKKISLDFNRKIYIFGASELGRILTGTLTMVGIMIDGYFDNAYPDGGNNEYFEILPLSYLEKLDRHTSYFIVGSSRRKEISSQLCCLGFTQIYFQNELSMYYNEAFTKIRFEHCADPEVSVLLTAYNGWNMTYNALKSLAENENQCKFEVILGDNCSSDLTKNAEGYLENVRVVHHKENLQYIGNANAIAEMARGEYLFLLSNDILFSQKKYIDILLNEAKKDSKIGMITGKLWVPCRNKYDVHYIYEKYDRCVEIVPDRPKNVENMWPVATIIPKRVWINNGGYDTAYLPVYYEDADFEMKVIHDGYDLVSYPYAEAVHYGGGTYLFDPQDPLIRKNKKLFESRWRGYLEDEGDRRSGYINAR